MKLFKKVLSNIDGSRVLDVATKEGDFVQTLMKNIKSYSEILGIDVNEQAIKIAQDKFEQENIQFLIMDAENLEFDNESFDTVSISASFHHFADIRRVLDEVKRVLKPEGTLIVAEMHRDGQTEAEFTSIYLHHWAADIDSALGRLHKHHFRAKS